MHAVTSLDEYYALVKAAKERCGSLKTNCALFPDAIKRYIGLGRFWGEPTENGVLFFADEERYYECYYHINPDASFELDRQDKPVVVQIMRNSLEKNDKVLRIEQRLGEAGFEYSDTMQMLKADPQQIMKKIAPLCRYAKREMEKDGFILCRVKPEQLPEFWSIADQASEIPYYLLPYYSDDELLEQIDKGWLTCIVDRQGKLCAAHHFFVDGKAMFGWLAVQKAYKNLYGMGMVFTEDALRYAIENGYLVSGWIDLKNTPSIQYHRQVGYQFVNRFTDRWVLPTKLS